MIMGMTITEKILAKASGNEKVIPGQIVVAKVDLAMVHDGLGPLVYPNFEKLETPIWDKDKLFIIIDHYAPASSLHQAEWIAANYEFAKKHQIPHLFNVQGVSHQIIPEGGYILPGQVAVGTDSHTCTYGALGCFSTGIGSTEMVNVFALGDLWFRVPETIKVVVTGKLPRRVMSKDIILKLLSMIGSNGATYKTLEFCGETIDEMSMDSRLTLCNMAIESGAKNGIIAPDWKTVEYLKKAGVDPDKIEMIKSDEDAVYCQEIHIDVSDLVPYVAVPHSPANGKPIEEVEGTPITQVMIGTCTNGRVEDFEMAADIIKGHKIPKEVRCIIMPASNKIYAELLKKGCMEIFAEAGCIICNPNCGACGGGHEGLLSAKESCLGTHNRNFKGRMGNPEAKIYLGSPATAAASAINGCITDPRKY